MWPRVCWGSEKNCSQSTRLDAYISNFTHLSKCISLFLLIPLPNHIDFGQREFCSYAWRQVNFLLFVCHRMVVFVIDLCVFILAGITIPIMLFDLIELTLTSIHTWMCVNTHSRLEQPIWSASIGRVNRICKQTMWTSAKWTIFVSTNATRSVQWNDTFVSVRCFSCQMHAQSRELFSVFLPVVLNNDRQQRQHKRASVF